jgi:hypothetical protein
MKIRPLVFAALLSLSACGETTTGTVVDTIASIELSPSNPSIDLGLSVQFEAQALNAAGVPIQGVTFTWSSSDTGVASISAAGLATGITVGTTAITASASSGTPASQVLSVQASQCDGRVEVSLAPGEHASYQGDTCLFLPTGQTGDRYRVAVARPTVIASASDVSDVTLRINPIFTTQQAVGAGGVRVAAAPSPSTAAELLGGAAGLDGSRFLEDAAIKARTRRFHAELRQRELELGFELLTTPVLESRPMAATGPSRVDPPSRADLYLGLTCSQSSTSPVVLVNFNDDLAIYQDSVERDSLPLTGAATSRMLNYFTDYVRDLVPQYWGPTPDIDGNGRVILTTNPALPDSAAAAVFSGDFVANTAGGCTGSNEAEVMYFSQQTIGNMDGPDPTYLALSVMAHEMKHVTSLYHGVARGDFHDTWIEEGTAEISQTISSRMAWEGIGGPAVGTQLDGGDIIDWNRDMGGIAPEMWGLLGGIADLVVHLSTQPNSLVTNPVGASPFHSFYAGGWQWHRFLGDAYGNATTPFADGPLFVEMTDSLTPSGTSAHLRVTGKTFFELFQELVVAMSLHAGTQPEPALSFTTWDLRSAAAIFTGPPEIAPPSLYPWPITAQSVVTESDGRQTSNTDAPFATAVYSCPPQVVGTGDDASYTLADPDARCPIGPSGIRFHDFVSDGSGAGAQIVVTGADTGQIIVTRLR